MLLALYALAFVALAVHAPDAVWQPGSREFFVILGAIGAWRYSWGALHLVRSLIYRRRVFPRLRRAAGRLVAAADGGLEDPPEGEVFVIVTSYRIRAETTALVYRAVIEEAIACRRRVTIVPAIVEVGDERFIKRLFLHLTPPERVRLLVVRLAATGKRDALATALRAVSRARPSPGAAVIVMDGDTVMRRGVIDRCLPFFRLLPRLGALTTDEEAVVADGPLMHAWHRLRFAQRHLLMSSMSLSRRLLTLTGRFSMFRVEIATLPSFIEAVQNDGLDHWRLGRVRFLTGEDKSTWFWLLQRGYDMIYVPDVQVTTIEHPPTRSFLRSTTQLMLRWFGNMLRTNGRAIALGPGRTGLFTWWCLVDQRISMWTPLVGPLVTLMAALTVTPVILYTYLLWIMATRLVQCLALLTVRPTVSGLYPFLIYYNQVYGALIKTFVLFRLDRQRWTRQNISLEPVLTRRERVSRAAVSIYVHALALFALASGLAFLAGALTLPSAGALARLF
jgi:glycosyltransferase Alg8